MKPLTPAALINPLPVSSVKGLIDYARRNPGKLTYGSSGIGSVPHSNVELFKAAAGDMRIVAGTPDELAAAMRADAELTAQLVKSIGRKPE